MASPPTRGSRLNVIAHNGCTFSYLHFPFCPCCVQVLLSSSSCKHLYRDFLLSIPTTTTQVKATVSVEFNRKINFTPDKAFNGKAMLGVWSGLRKQMSEREVPREQECWVPLPLPAKGPCEDTVLPKPSESPRGSCCGGEGDPEGSAASKWGRRFLFSSPSPAFHWHLLLARPNWKPCWGNPQDADLMDSLECKAGQGANLEAQMMSKENSRQHHQGLSKASHLIIFHNVTRVLFLKRNSPSHTACLQPLNDSWLPSG